MVLPVGICMMIILFGSCAIFWKKIKKSSSIHPEQHPHQQNQGFNTQSDNDIGIIYVAIVFASILVPGFLIAQQIIPPTPLYMINTLYGAIYVPSLVIPITFPCCN
jgi:hypothetical protein